MKDYNMNQVDELDHFLRVEIDIAENALALKLDVYDGVEVGKENAENF